MLDLFDRIYDHAGSYNDPPASHSGRELCGVLPLPAIAWMSFELSVSLLPLTLAANVPTMLCTNAEVCLVR